MRHPFLLTVVMLPLAAVAEGGTAESQARPAVGAIRWDAWHGDRGVPGKAVQNSLGPKKWHHRLPFFAKVLGEDKIWIDGSSQEVMDRELQYAWAAGLDYWAFVTYPPRTAMSLGLERYLSSRRRGLVDFCLLTECSRWTDAKGVDRVARLMRENGYRKVLGGRPLLYLGFISADKLKRNWGGARGFRKVIDEFRRKVRASGLANPYIVIMDFHPPQGKKRVDELGCDAITSYAVGGGGSNVPYAQLAQKAEKFWDRCKATGAQVVPIVMTGWDRRPRVERPVPWEKWQKPGVGIEKYYQAPTPRELAAHVRKAVDWLRANRSHAKAQAALIYAWNENDEGGWLVPTLSEGPARVDAVREALGRQDRRPRPVKGGRSIP
ncbi:MAG: glycoside hydrolase family 71/99 protein [Planctomycetota bacterium]|jgi:hypothetical protein